MKQPMIALLLTLMLPCSLHAEILHCKIQVLPVHESIYAIVVNVFEGPAINRHSRRKAVLFLDSNGNAREWRWLEDVEAGLIKDRFTRRGYILEWKEGNRCFRVTTKIWKTIYTKHDLELDNRDVLPTHKRTHFIEPYHLPHGS